MVIVAWACNPSTEEAKAGGQGFIDLLNKFEASLGYMRPHLKTTTKSSL